MSTAVNAFLKALVREGGMPFEMRVQGKARPDVDAGHSPRGKERAGAIAETIAVGRWS